MSCIGKIFQILSGQCITLISPSLGLRQNPIRKYAYLFQVEGINIYWRICYWENISWEVKSLGGERSRRNLTQREVSKVPIRICSLWSYFLLVDSNSHMEIVKRIAWRAGIFTELEFSWGYFDRREIIHGKNSSWGVFSQDEFSRGSFLREQLSKRGQVICKKIFHIEGIFQHDFKTFQMKIFFRWTCAKKNLSPGTIHKNSSGRIFT